MWTKIFVHPWSWRESAWKFSLRTFYCVRYSTRRQYTIATMLHEGVCRLVWWMCDIHLCNIFGEKMLKWYNWRRWGASNWIKMLCVHRMHTCAYVLFGTPLLRNTLHHNRFQIMRNECFHLRRRLRKNVRYHVFYIAAMCSTDQHLPI